MHRGVYGFGLLQIKQPEINGPHMFDLIQATNDVSIDFKNVSNQML